MSSTDNQQVGLSLFRVSCDRLVRTMPIEAGQTLLHYRLIDKIGEGGMGVVWKTVDT